MDQRTPNNQHAHDDQSGPGKRLAPAKGGLHGALAYAIILSTCIGGLLHASWWTVCAGASLLALLSIADSQGAHANYGRLRGHVSPAALYASTVLNAAAAASAAYLLGRVIAWYWVL